jgi:hypothetical protein
MATLQDFSIDRGEDATVRIVLSPPTAIGGWHIRFLATRRFGSLSGIFSRECASGYNGVSGVTVINSGTGVFDVRIDSVDTSGRSFANIVHCTKRLDSGHVTPLVEGFISLMPENG